MGPLRGTSARLAAGWVLLSVAVAACAAPGASAPRAGGQGSVTAQQASPSGPATARYMPSGMPPGTATAPPTTPVPAGCPSGTVVITHHFYEGNTSAVCIKAGARLRLTLPGEGLDGWYPLQVTPDAAATVAYTTAPTDILAAIVTPTGTAPFCLSTGTRSLESQPAYSWRLCVTVRR
jgi:hypothetical protein